MASPIVHLDDASQSGCGVHAWWEQCARTVDKATTRPHLEHGGCAGSWFAASAQAAARLHT